MVIKTVSEICSVVGSNMARVVWKKSRFVHRCRATWKPPGSGTILTWGSAQVALIASLYRRWAYRLHWWETQWHWRSWDPLENEGRSLVESRGQEGAGWVEGRFCSNISCVLEVNLPGAFVSKCLGGHLFLFFPIQC
jgi:hypothetical protein